MTSWSSNNSAGAFASPLKLVVAGSRGNSNGTVLQAGSTGHYWSSTVDVSHSHAGGLYFDSGSAGQSIYRRAYGRSVRCIKD